MNFLKSLDKFFYDLIMSFFKQKPNPVNPTPTPAPQPIVDPVNEKWATLLKLHNDHRKKNGRNELILSEELCTLSQKWAENMASKNRMYHDRGHAENIGMGYPDDNAVFNGWKNSSGHNANILGGHRNVGFGVASARGGTKYWCAKFN